GDGLQAGKSRLPVIRVAGERDVLPGALAHRDRARPDPVLDDLAHRVFERRPDVLPHYRRLPGDLIEVRNRRLLEGHDDLAATVLRDAVQDLPHRLQVELRMLLD